LVGDEEAAAVLGVLAGDAGAQALRDSSVAVARASTAARRQEVFMFRGSPLFF
jgi:hypothetical protein